MQPSRDEKIKLDWGFLPKQERPVYTGCGGDRKDQRDDANWSYEFKNNTIYRGF